MAVFSAQLERLVLFDGGEEPGSHEPDLTGVGIADLPPAGSGLGNELEQAPRPTKERIFNQLMIERTVIAALFMGTVGFGLFQWCLAAGWSEDAARNALLIIHGKRTFKVEDDEGSKRKMSAVELVFFLNLVFQVPR